MFRAQRGIVKETRGKRRTPMFHGGGTKEELEEQMQMLKALPAYRFPLSVSKKAQRGQRDEGSGRRGNSSRHRMDFGCSLSLVADAENRTGGREGGSDDQRSRINSSVPSFTIPFPSVFVNGFFSFTRGPRQVAALFSSYV